MKSRLPTLVGVLAIGLLAGCDNQNSASQPAQAAPAVQYEATATPRPATPPVPSVPTGEASTTRNLYFVLDGSGSMEEKCSGQRKVEAAKTAAKEFIKIVPTGDNLALYIFDERGEREVVPLGPNNRGAVIAGIDAMRAGGGTPLQAAIERGVAALTKQREKQLGYGEYRLIVVTDGQASGIPQAAKIAEQSGIPIYTIGLCIEGGHELRKYSLTYRDANTASDLKKGLEEAAAESASFDVKTFEEGRKK